MKYLTLILFVLGLVAVAFVPSADAGQCASTPVVYQQPVVQQQVVAAPVVATPVVVAQFVPVVVPAYQVGYDPATLGIVEELRAIKEELRIGREALTVPKTGGPLTLPQTLPQTLPPDNPMEPLPEPVSKAQTVLQTHCAACHTGATAKAGVKIFEEPGKLALVDRFTLWDVAETQKMPPKTRTKLTPAELVILRDWVRESTAKRK